MVMEYFDFKDYKFCERHSGEGAFVRVVFKKFYYFEIPRSEFSEIGIYSIKDGQIGFENTDKIGKKFIHLLDKYLRNNLIHTLNGKRTVYIDRESEIPLIGSNEFGIVDRNTSVLEIKPLTGCNHNCVFCSVDEGQNKKNFDYLVDCDYLVSEVEKVAALKKNPIEINIGPQGEPLLYPDIVDLIENLKKIPNIYFISMNSNGSLLTKELVDQLFFAGLGRINLSINSADGGKEKELSGNSVNLHNIITMAEYAKGKFQIMLAPVIVPGLNDDENNVDALIKFGMKLKKEFPFIGIQNFLEYDGGRVPIKKARSMEEFYKWLMPFENKHAIRLKLTNVDFNIFPDKVLNLPMRKDDVVKAQIKCHGRKKGEVVCSANGRCITVRGCMLDKGTIKVKIVRDKHNIFVGVLV